MKELKDRAVLITGAAGGIGRATALAFAREGASPLILNDVNREGLEEVAAELEGLGCEAVTFPADVTDHEAVAGMVRTALDDFGRIDVLVNVAGIGIMGPLEHQDLDDWRRVIDVNLWGTINTVRAAYPHMMERRSGHIVNIASVSGLWADMLYIAPYVTSKFGVVGLSRALLVEGSLSGIDVTCICPGVVKTPIYRTGEMKGFKPEARDLYRYLSYLGESPGETASAIVKAVKKNRFFVVTTPFYRFDYFVRRHFSFITDRFDRVWPRLMARGLRRYMLAEQPRR